MSSARSRSGWDLNRKDVEPVEQVFAKRVFDDPLLEIPVRGGDNPHVHGYRFRTSEPFDLPLLQHAEQLDLHLGRQVADLVEEDGRAVGQFEASDLPRERTREGALLATEQLALDQGRGDGRAIHTHHDLPAPRAQLVKMGGDEFLAGTGLTKQQHR